MGLFSPKSALNFCPNLLVMHHWMDDRFEAAERERDRILGVLIKAMKFKGTETNRNFYLISGCGTEKFMHCFFCGQRTDALYLAKVTVRIRFKSWISCL